ncbi:1,4-alpha-glucan branching protein [Candidatus Saccharibacteria bacterium]|nr:1,4-alpha-glucan branching protein [Candidatus Saccharibacteria bacterium]
MSHQVKKNLGVTLHSGGAEFRVWAPFAKSVSLEGTFTSNGSVKLYSENDGYWAAQVPDVKAGQNYTYVIEAQDGSILRRNDPRAKAITSSDNGFSVVVDNEFNWSDDVFMPVPKKNQIIYELHVGTFNRVDASTPGTFDSAISKLDYLTDLGVTMIELMPVTSMAYSNGWGYAPNYIFSVESMLGGRHGLMNFVKECHARGIGVILDVVYNHFFGDTDLWQFDGWSENDRGGIYFYNDYRGDTPWGGRPDYGRPEVRQFILDNVTMWLNEYRLDGLRVDSTIYMRNTEGYPNDPEHDLPDAWTLLQDISKLAHKINPQAIIIAEDSSCSDYITKPIRETGCGFDSQWQLGFPHALRNALGLTQDYPQSLADITSELTQSYNQNIYERVIFSDSHDTAANGSVRLNQAATPNDASSLFARQEALVADAVTLTGAGIPMLLQGAEFVQEGAFNDWQALQWEKAEKYKGLIVAHRHLIDLRLNRYNNTRGLQGQSTAIFHRDDDNYVIGYHRWDQGGPKDDVLVIVNFSKNELHDYEIILPVNGDWVMRFNSSWQGYSKDFKEVSIDHISKIDKNPTSFSLPAFGVLILSQD